MLTSEDAEARGAHEHKEDYCGEGEYDEYMFDLGLNGMSVQELLNGDKPDVCITGRAPEFWEG